ncbi:Multifunctional non-homologous end joining protein LigD (Includes: 3'-phosphoesterase; DNA ligase D; DNA repair polymerase) [Paraburkholderia piptadeniae]|uniref:DNA ligase (ATP) n=1 Tax=Paraburkholderia piptadeniae TaxID=1701573 RepID=A0A1N7S7Z2_9BURK|nr:DNA ligase D [Paraburkholderia piptadeniae]SIT43422.1 Multifunctional non-homologous end joining protein LigD (Includes: 3'-phosphoesterase; DNA ligase D; DNA repair polymerase) [Paraburkholderia piptadeniae]
MTDKLETYHRKRRFDRTPEPSGIAARATSAKSAKSTPKTKRATNTPATAASKHALSFVIQEHDARRLHYDFRLELDGTLKSWAVPKGPSLDPSVKRLAVHVEDHPLEYGSFEGDIPEGNYGAGSVIVWDRGTWEPVGGEAGAREAYAAGKLKFHLDGEKLRGGWTLVRSHMQGSGDKEQWLLIKERDDEARSEAEFDVLEAMQGSVISDAPGARGGGDGAGKWKTNAQRANVSIRPTKATASRRAKGSPDGHPDIVATRSPESLRELAVHPSIEGAVEAKMSATLKPQLATLVDTAPAGGDWLYEIKFDGYRVLARIDHQAKEPVKVFTRAGNDWTAKFRKQAQAFERIGLDCAWLDGEAVVLDSDGVPSFQLLQNAFDANRPQDITLYLFDLPYLNGYDLRGVPLVQRRAILRALMETVDDDTLRFSDDFGHDAGELLESACAMNLEGIIGKRRDSHYASGRAPSWIKLKCRRRQEFVIGGYTEPAGSREAFGALLLGVYDTKGKLQYAGRVGTGFNAALLRSMKQQLDARETAKMPFASEPRERSRTPVHWVKPELVAECNFAEWTSDGVVRQASFVSLRSDKPAKQIVHETPHKGADVDQMNEEPDADNAKTSIAKRSTAKASTAKKPDAQAASATTTKRSGSTTTVAGVRISHPDRVIDKSTGVRKIELVEYYESVASWMLPHLKDRPVALVRAPDDIGGELFFQKHSQKLSIPNITQHPGLDPDHPPLLTVESDAALVGAAQMGTIELHTWNAVAANIEKPDRMVFDLDPDPALGWKRMIEAAQLTRELLKELGLASFCKTSGGKGLHVVVPIAKQLGWDDVKAFSQAVAQHMANALPKHFAAKMGAQNRKGKIFVDYLRNNRGSSTVCAYSLRARPGLGVSVPLAWDEVPDTTAGDQWSIANVHERLDALKSDPWAAYAKTKQRITAQMRGRLDTAEHE